MFGGLGLVYGNGNVGVKRSRSLVTGVIGDVWKEGVEEVGAAPGAECVLGFAAVVPLWLFAFANAAWFVAMLAVQFGVGESIEVCRVTWPRLMFCERTSPTMLGRVVTCLAGRWFLRYTFMASLVRLGWPGLGGVFRARGAAYGVAVGCVSLVVSMIVPSAVRQVFEGLAMFAWNTALLYRVNSLRRESWVRDVMFFGWLLVPVPLLWPLIQLVVWIVVRVTDEGVGGDGLSSTEVVMKTEENVVLGDIPDVEKTAAVYEDSVTVAEDLEVEEMLQVWCGWQPTPGEMLSAVELWSSNTTDEAWPRVRVHAVIGDRVLKLLLALYVQGIDGTASDISRLEQQLQTDVAMRAYMKGACPVWWAKVDESMHGKAASTVYEAMWGLCARYVWKTPEAELCELSRRVVMDLAQHNGFKEDGQGFVKMMSVG